MSSEKADADQSEGVPNERGRSCDRCERPIHDLEPACVIRFGGAVNTDEIISCADCFKILTEWWNSRSLDTANEQESDDLRTDGGENVGSESDNQRTHHYTDAPECDWCRQSFEDGETVVALTWEFPSSDIIVTFCSDECATEWDCSKSRKRRDEVIIHV